MNQPPVKATKKKKRRRTRPRKGETAVEARYRQVLEAEERWMVLLTKALTKLKEIRKRRRYYEKKFAAERAATKPVTGSRRLSLDVDV